MKFVYPEFLWAFGVLVIPIIVHLFNFRKYKVLYFSSLKFIQFIDQQTRSTQKLKHLLVLLARIFAFACLVIAFAQPYLPPVSSSMQGGKTVLAIYIDNSFSMSMKGSEGEMISEARETARKLITDASLDTRILLVTNSMNGIEQHLVSKPEALERLDKITISPLVRSIVDVIEWEKNALKTEHETNQRLGIRQFVLLSDFQKNTSDLSGLKSDSSTYYFPVQLVPQESSNLYVDSVWFSSPIHKIGERNELNVRIQNEGEKDLTNIELHLELGAINRDVFVDLPANGQVTTQLNYTEKTEGTKEGKVSINDKQFFYDDAYYFSYQVSKKASVLIINGQNSVKNISTVYSLDNYYVVNEIEQASFTLDALEGKDLVVVNGANEIPSGFADELVEYAQNGGSLALFPGEEIDGAKSGWNNLLSTLKLPTLGGLISDGLKIKKLNFEDSFFQSVFEKKPEQLNLPSIAKAYRINSFSHSESVGLLFLQNGSPLYLRSLGQINVFLYTSSLTSSYGSFTSNALFSTLLLRTAELSQRKTPLSLTIGSDSYFPIYGKVKNETPIHLKNTEIDFIPKSEHRGTITYVSLNGMEEMEKSKAGTYQLFTDKIIGSISLNYNRAESKIDCYSFEQIIEQFKEKGIKHLLPTKLSEGQNIAQIDLEKPYEFWKLLLLLSLIFFFIEMILLKFWKQKKPTL